MRNSLSLIKPSGLPTISATAQTDRKRGRYSQPSPPWYSPPLSAVPGLTHFEVTAVQVILAGRPFKILAAYLSPSRPLIGADLTTCFGGGLPVLMAGDLNAKYVDWNSRLTKRRGKLLRDYADENSCLIFGPETPTTNPYNNSATPDVLDIAVRRISRSRCI